MTDTIATFATAGSLAELQREGRLLTKVGTLPVVVVLARGRGATRSRTAARTSASRCTRARSRPAWSRATGTTPASTSCRAARSTCGPTTRTASTSSSRGDDVFVDARARRDPRRAPAAAAAQRPRGGTSRSSSPSRCSACSKPACRRPRSCAPASSSVHATAATVGAPASPCSSRWPTCSPHLDPDDRALALVHGARVRRVVTRENQRRASPSARSDADGADVDRLSDWYRRFVDTRSRTARAHARDRARRPGAPRTTSRR